LLHDLEDVSGVGIHKKEKYGQQFIEVIQEYVSGQDTLKNVKGKTHLETLQLFKEGLSPEQIAEKRKVNLVTIYSHLADLYEKGEEIPLESFVASDKRREIQQVWTMLGKPDELKPVYDELAGKAEYYEIRVAVALYRTSK
jgi:ATP-dependent DNA helicase RecQ